MELTISIIAIVLSLFAIVNDYVAVIRQNRAAFFSSFTERYERIIMQMPEELITDSDVNGDNISVGSLRCLRVYFDLCSEEYYLHRQYVIKGNVWKYWCDGMTDTIGRSSLYRLAWFGKYSLRSQYNDKFRDFMDGVFEEAKKMPSNNRAAVLADAQL